MSRNTLSLLLSLLWFTTPAASQDRDCHALCLEEWGRVKKECFSLEDPEEAAACMDKHATLLEDALQACEERNADNPDGDGVDDCFENAHHEFEQCHLLCLLPGEEDRCFVDCDFEFQDALAECGDLPDPESSECFQAAEDAHQACVFECLPDDQRCEVECENDLREQLDACDAIEEGEERDACVERIEGAYVGCLTDCGADETRVCFSRCELDYVRKLDECGAGGNDVDGNDIDENGDVKFGPDGVLIFGEECFQLAELEFHECELECFPEDDPQRCFGSCEIEFQRTLLTCDTDECFAEAHESFASCLEGCGIQVPDIPPPDPCTSQCDIAYDNAIQKCFGADGFGPDGQLVEGEEIDECLIELDRRYVGCLEECGVDIPNPPEVPDEPCVFECDSAHLDIFMSCLDPATGQVTEDCVAAADVSYLECLKSCGVEIPDDPDLPGPPQSGCSFECDASLLNGMTSCFDAAGNLSVECVLNLVTSFEECRGGCEDDAENRLVAALLRFPGSRAPFIRGDANQDNGVNISDARFLLSELFLSGKASTCEDASDANDDGKHDISDPVRDPPVPFPRHLHHPRAVSGTRQQPDSRRPRMRRRPVARNCSSRSAGAKSCSYSCA